MTDRYTEYDNWAWLYNRTLGPLFANKKLRWLTRVLLPYVPRNAKLLDVCCGTGQITQLLMNRGYQVTGLDGSEAMLAFAKINAPDATFLVADARSFVVSDKFDGAFSTCASLNYVSRIDELQLIFSRVSHSLKDRSIFAFDIYNPASMRLQWRGHAAFGGIEKDHAWVCKGYYDGTSTHGCFTVDIYQPRCDSSPAQISMPKRLTGRMLNYDCLTRMRMKLLDHFDKFQPQWGHTRLTYTVYAHDLTSVALALKESFTDVSLQTEDGSPIVTEKDLAHFVCRK